MRSAFISVSSYGVICVSIVELFLSRIQLLQKFSDWPGSSARRRDTAPTMNQPLSAARDSIGRVDAGLRAFPPPNVLCAVSGGAWKLRDGKREKLGRFLRPAEPRAAANPIPRAWSDQPGR